jgi:hypothetical protein
MHRLFNVRTRAYAGSPHQVGDAIDDGPMSRSQAGSAYARTTPRADRPRRRLLHTTCHTAEALVAKSNHGSRRAIGIRESKKARREGLGLPALLRGLRPSNGFASGHTSPERGNATTRVDASATRPAKSKLAKWSPHLEDSRPAVFQRLDEHRLDCDLGDEPLEHKQISASTRHGQRSFEQRFDRIQLVAAER